MALRAPYMPPHAELNDFLFAQMGADKSGMVVTVASAIARSGIDPWQEAARIASLSRSAAIQALLPMITRSSETVDPDDARASADRLVRLLPRRVSVTSQSAGWKLPALSPVSIWLACLFLALGLLFWTMRDSPTGIEQSPAGFSSRSDSSQSPERTLRP